MKLWTNLCELPSQEQIDSQKVLRLSLIWIIAFFVLLRGLALLQFLIDLDYSEVNTVKLIQFVFMRFLFLGLLAYLMYQVWYKPHRFTLLFIGSLSFISLWKNHDLVSVFSACIVLALVSRLYAQLYALANKELPTKPSEEPPTGA
jgi:hypothetical protein